MTDFKAKMHQIRFWLGLCPRAHWGSLQHAPPDPLAGFGALLPRRGEGRGGEERRAEGRGREEREGEGKERAMSPPLFGGSLRLWQSSQT